MTQNYILAIDQGTTSCRAIIFDENMAMVASADKEFNQYFLNPGWVEHDADEIYATTIAMCHEAVEKAHLSFSQIAAIGITNQRETIVMWDRRSGDAIYNAIVWQDRRTAPHCKNLKNDNIEGEINRKTGLLLDPYFSASKISWILNNVNGARDAADKGHLLCGTIDSYLIWRLTGGASHLTDATNASRTMLYNIQQQNWDDDLCKLFNIPQNILPMVKNCADDFGICKPHIFGYSIPISGVAGDQQAAAIGQGCFSPGMVKSTYGTGCFALLNTGDEIVYSRHKLLSTVAYQLDGKTNFALEGSIFNAGSVVQWLRDGLKIIQTAQETTSIIQERNKGENIIIVPAFTGLGAPYWHSTCKGAIFGITRDTTAADITLAALQAIAYQTDDLLKAMQADWQNKSIELLRVDGGMCANDYAMQFLANITNCPTIRPAFLESTALGAAWLAGMQNGLYPPDGKLLTANDNHTSFTPAFDSEQRLKKIQLWRQAVQATMTVEFD